MIFCRRNTKGGRETKKQERRRGLFMPLLRKGGSMLGKFYESVLDVELYRQMADLIYRLSEVKEKEQLYTGIKNGALFTIKPEMEMEDAFGFRYPGEVLERQDEKETVTKKQVR